MKIDYEAGTVHTIRVEMNPDEMTDLRIDLEDYADHLAAFGEQLEPYSYGLLSALEEIEELIDSEDVATEDVGAPPEPQTFTELVERMFGVTAADLADYERSVLEELDNAR